jgi:hypothetical protein
MTTMIAGGTVAALALAAYVRWAVRPVLLAYRTGECIGRRQAGK